MKHINKLLVFLFMSNIGFLVAQTTSQTDEGVVSYVSTKQVYVKFTSTKNIQAGDTLYFNKNGVLIPTLLVTNKSSISCVCELIGDEKVEVSQKIVFKPSETNVTPAVLISDQQKEVVTPSKNEVVDVSPGKQKYSTAPAKSAAPISGRLSIGSYTTISSENPTIAQRMRYTFSMKADHIAQSKLSAETYFTFSHRENQWEEIKNDVFNGLKIYTFSLRYDINAHHSILLGRKINPKISQIGTSDGLQYEVKIKNLTAGVIAGSRPDMQNFTINTALFQVGGYLSHEKKLAKGIIQTSIAMIEQKNGGQTDRRFVYLQHTNSLVTNVFLFGSVEFDLYQLKNEVKSTTPKLTNSFVSLRYRPLKQLSFALSYSNRQNIIYYETYKNIIEQLLEREGTQGIQFQTSYRPFSNINVGLRAGYRHNLSDLKPSKNAHAYVNIGVIPWIHAGGSISATYLESSYMKGTIYSASLMKDFYNGKLNSTLTYRNVQYQYNSGEFTQDQHIAEIGLGYRLAKKLFLGVNTEHTFEKDSNSHRIYLNLTQRL